MVWDISAGLSRTTEHVLAVPNAGLLATSPTAPILATPACANSPSRCGIELRDAENGVALGEPFSGDPHKSDVRALAFNATGAVVASGGSDGAVLLWDVASRSRRGQLTGRASTSPVHGLAFGARAGHEVLAVADDTRQITLWNLQTGAQEFALAIADADLRSLAMSPDGKLIAAGTDDGRILIWDTASGDLALPPLSGHVGSVRLLAFEARTEDRLLASIDEVNRIILWDVDAARPVAYPPNHHDQPIASVEFPHRAGKQRSRLRLARRPTRGGLDARAASRPCRTPGTRVLDRLAQSDAARGAALSARRGAVPEQHFERLRPSPTCALRRFARARGCAAKRLELTKDADHARANSANPTPPRGVARLTCRGDAPDNPAGRGRSPRRACGRSTVCRLPAQSSCNSRRGIRGSWLLVDYSQDTDPDHLLGLPGQYIAKAALNDPTVASANPQAGHRDRGGVYGPRARCVLALRRSRSRPPAKRTWRKGWY